MPILAAYVVPHPPLIVPCVGGGKERDIQATIDAYREVAHRIACLKPDTLILSSPHAPFFRNCFFVATGDRSHGDMAGFHVADPGISVDCDDELSRLIISTASQRGVPAVTDPGYSTLLDHGSYVPLHFVNEQWTDYRLARVGLSLLDAQTHRDFGGAIRYAADELGRRCVYIASGDLSHKLKPDGPYGFVPEGPEFDAEISKLFQRGNLEGLFHMDPAMCEEAAECGLRSFQIMAGALGDDEIEPELLSYEGPFGVGYGVAAFEVKGDRHAE